MLASTPAQISSLASDIYNSCTFAISAISELPESEDELLPVLKFLSQSGDYTAYISAKIIDSKEISDEEFENLKKLAHHAKITKDELVNMSQNLSIGNFSYETTNSSSLVSAFADGTNYTDGMKKIYKEFVNYPALIYDGPFSERDLKEETKLLEGKEFITQSEALSIASIYLGEERSKNLIISGEKNSPLPSYIISGGDDEREITLEITKKGGMPLWFLDSKTSTVENLSPNEAIAVGAKYLKQMGYSSMTETYYEKNRNSFTVNYAYEQDGIIVYPDLIKLKISAENGEILGFESAGYISSHCIRTPLKDIISPKQAQEKVSPRFNITSVRLAYIPKESTGETLCYEFSGEFNDRKFLIYLNAQTGKDEKILMLVESENGILTI